MPRSKKFIIMIQDSGLEIGTCCTCQEDDDAVIERQMQNPDNRELLFQRVMANPEFQKSFRYHLK